MDNNLIYSEDGKIVIGVIDKNITHITIPPNVIGIGREAFSNCHNLIDIEFSVNLREIGVHSFWCCSSLAKVNLPDSMLSIGEGAFVGCEKLESVKYSSNLKEIGYAAFNNTKWYENQPNGLIIINDTLYKWKGEMPSEYNLSIPPSVKRIADFAFDGCSNLQSVEFPSIIYNLGEIEQGVCSIGDYAFCNCKSLKEITIPDSVEKIGMGAFKGCIALRSISLPDIMTIVENELCKGCTSLYSISLPDKIRTIAQEAFEGCFSLSWITLPNRLNLIESRAFANCSSLERINIPASTNVIQNQAFSSCISLKNVRFNLREDESPFSFGEELFDGCVKLESIYLPEGLTKIPECTFRGCSTLVEIDIPNTVTKIDVGAFVSCSSLTVIDIPPSVLSIGDIAFEGCLSLNEIYFADNIEELGYSSFRYCSSIEKLVLPKKMKKIGEHAFSDCLSLKTIEIHDNIEEINNSAFEGCASLENIYICSENPFQVKQGFNIFKGVNKYKCVVHVPFGSHWLYKHDFSFHEFKNIETFSTVSGNIVYKKNNFILDENGESATIGQIAEYIINQLDLDEEDSSLFCKYFVKDEEACILSREALKGRVCQNSLENEGYDLNRIIKLIDELPDKGNGTCVLPRSIISESSIP